MTSDPPSRGWRRLALLALVLSAVAACGDTTPKPQAPQVTIPWEGQLRDLFDDQIHPSAVGLSLDGRSPATDPMLRERARSADVVARMRVQTVTRDQVGAKMRYVLNLQVGVPHLMPPKAQDRMFELSIRQGTGAFGVVRSLDNALRGKTFIGFVKRFAGERGPEIHWHLTADSKEVADVIAEIAVLEEVAGQ